MSSAARQVVGITVMVLGVALLIATSLVDIPGLRQGRTRDAGRISAACYAAAFAAILGGGWLSAQPS